MFVQRSFSSLSKKLHHNTLVWHPIIVACHLVFIAGLATVLQRYVKDWPQQIFLMTTIFLYCASAAYHAAGKDSPTLRTIDQIGISAFIHAVPLALVAHSKVALALLALSFAYSLYLKLGRREGGFETESIVFLLQGIFAIGLFVFIGAPNLPDSHYWQIISKITVAVSCFVGMLVIYRLKKLRLSENLWSEYESGHFVLAFGVIVHTHTVVWVLPSLA